jgi:hypothetical protein
VQVPSELRRGHALGGDVLGEQSDQWRQLRAEHQAAVNRLFLPWFGNVEQCHIEHDQYNFQHNILCASDSVRNHQLTLLNLRLSNVIPAQPDFYVNIDFQHHSWFQLQPDLVIFIP